MHIIEGGNIMKKMNTNLMKKTKLAAVIAGMTMAIVTGCGKEAKLQHLR